MNSHEAEANPLPVDDLLRYGRQVVLKAMDDVRSRMRGSRRLELAKAVTDQELEKSRQNPTHGIDRETEDLIISARLTVSEAKIGSPLRDIVPEPLTTLPVP